MAGMKSAPVTSSCPKSRETDTGNILVRDSVAILSRIFILDDGNCRYLSITLEVKKTQEQRTVSFIQKRNGVSPPPERMRVPAPRIIFPGRRGQFPGWRQGKRFRSGRVEGDFLQGMRYSNPGSSGYRGIGTDNYGVKEYLRSRRRSNGTCYRNKPELVQRRTLSCENRHNMLCYYRMV